MAGAHGGRRDSARTVALSVEGAERAPSPFRPSSFLSSSSPTRLQRAPLPGAHAAAVSKRVVPPPDPPPKAAVDPNPISPTPLPAARGDRTKNHVETGRRGTSQSLRRATLTGGSATPPSSAGSPSGPKSGICFAPILPRLLPAQPAASRAFPALLGGEEVQSAGQGWDGGTGEGEEEERPRPRGEHHVRSPGAPGQGP